MQLPLLRASRCPEQPATRVQGRHAPLQFVL